MKGSAGRKRTDASVAQRRNPGAWEGGKAGLLIRKHDHFTPARKMRQDVRALTAHNHPEGRYYPMKRHVWERVC